MTVRKPIAYNSVNQMRDILGGADHMPWFNPAEICVSGDDFLTGVAGTGFTTSVSGTGAAVNALAAEAGTVGLLDLTTGTATNGRAGVLTDAAAISMGSGVNVTVVDAYVRIPTLSDGTNRFTVRAGLIDDAGNPAPMPDGVFFTYIDNTNSGRWRGNCNEASVATAIDLGVAATTSWTHLRAVIDATAANVDFYIGGTYRGSITTNIPSSTNYTGLGASIVKSVGTAARSLYVDALFVRCQMAAKRF